MASEDLSAWAGRILETLISGSATSGSILNWLQYNPYRLNAAFGTSYNYSGSGIEPTITSLHSGVYEEMHMCYYLNKMAMDTLGIAAFDLVENENDGQGRQRFVSRNERAKTFRYMAGDCSEKLTALIDLVDNAGNGPLAAQILFSDRNNMVYGDQQCVISSQYYTPGNTIFSQFYAFSD